MHFSFRSDICGAYGSSTYMCPRCDKSCPFWKLSDSCVYSKVDQSRNISLLVVLCLNITGLLCLRQRGNSYFRGIDVTLGQVSEDISDTRRSFLGQIVRGVLETSRGRSTIRLGIWFLMIRGCFRNCASRIRWISKRIWNQCDPNSKTKPKEKLSNETSRSLE